MDRKLNRDAAHVADAVADAARELEMVAVAGSEVGPGLGDADDRPARLQLLAGEPIVQIALQIERRHVGLAVVVPPVLAAQPPLALIAHPWPRARIRRPFRPTAVVSSTPSKVEPSSDAGGGGSGPAAMQAKDAATSTCPSRSP